MGATTRPDWPSPFRSSSGGLVACPISIFDPQRAGAGKGVHHVHHLNASIPFYRLREAMSQIPELQHPVLTRLRVRDILECFKANLCDPRKMCMISYKEAKTLTQSHD